ncbi:MAG TPA: MgtC/SapB family protein [Thermoanaerobaculia bacterium]
MNVESPIIELAVALGLGLLVGLQRERYSESAGLRTFALVTLAGTIAGQLLPITGGALVAVGLFAVAALAAAGHFRDDQKSGLTTEAAMIAMYLIGVYLSARSIRIAVVLGGSVAVLLHAKARFRRIMERLGDDDVRAIMQFALLALVILPMLPDRDFGPWGVLNVFEVWLLVVLIVGINLAGYIAWKFTRDDTGALVTGLLGGVVSSTATTVSYSKRADKQDGAAPVAAVVIVIATAVVLVRVLIEVAVVAPSLFGEVALPLGTLLVIAATVAAAMWWRTRGTAADMPDQKNPTMLRAALLFGAMYAVVLLAVAWTRELAGERGLFVAAAIAGMTDVDAITLSMSRVAVAGQITAAQLWRVIVVAFLSNLVFKALIVAFTGSRRLLAVVSVAFGVMIAGATVIMMVMR